MQHVHKYKRINLGKRGREFMVYRCVTSGCTHHIRTDMSHGVEALCWKCGIPFNIDARKRLAKPHCSACVTSKATKDTRKTKHAAERLANELYIGGK